VVGPAAVWEDAFVEDRPVRVAFICSDCGRPLDPVEALEVDLAQTVMKVCPTCFAVREELGRLLT